MSRKLMKRCRENIVMKALAEDMEPHYSTISDFIKEKGEEIKNVFKEVLLVCDELKLIEGSTFAIDGCKITSNASKEWSGTHEELEKKAAKFEKVAAKIVSQHQARDQREVTPGTDRAKEQEQAAKKIERIEAKAKKIRKFLSTHQPKLGSGGDEI